MTNPRVEASLTQTYHTRLTMMRDRQYVPAMTPTLVTADQLERLRLPDKHVELVKGVLIVKEPAGYRHGAVAARLAKVLMDYADAQDVEFLVGLRHACEDRADQGSNQHETANPTHAIPPACPYSRPARPGDLDSCASPNGKKHDQYRAHCLFPSYPV